MQFLEAPEYDEHLDDFTYCLMKVLQLQFTYYIYKICWNWCVKFVLKLSRILRQMGFSRAVIAYLSILVMSSLVFAPIGLPVYLFSPLFAKTVKDSVVEVFQFRHSNIYRQFAMPHEAEAVVLDRHDVQDLLIFRSLKRYLWEDVTMACDFEIPVNVDVEDITIRMSWRLNNTSEILPVGGRTAVYSRGYIMSGAPLKTELAGTRRYLTKERLMVSYLTEEMFGQFSCHAQITFTAKPSERKKKTSQVS